MECDTDGSDTCLTCNNDYILFEDTCVSAVSSSYYDEWTPRLVLLITSVTILLILLSGLFMAKPVSTIWLITGQLRSVLLILLTGAYLSNQVVDYLRYFRFAMMSFKHVPVLKYLALEEVVTEYFDSNDQTDERLDSVGVYDKTALIVCMPIIVMIVFIAIAHASIAGLNACVKSKHLNTKFSNFIQRLKKIFAFSVYLRLIMEAYQLLLISSVSEIYRADLNTISQNICFAISVVICTLCVSFLIMSILSIPTKSDKPSIFRELYKGLKKSKAGRLYPFMCLLKRSLMVILLVALEFLSLPTREKLIIMAVMQILHLAYVAVFRSYKNVKDNVIDMVNEGFMLIVLIVLATHHTISSWDENIVNFVIYGSVANHTVVLLVVFGDSVISLFR